MWILRSSVGLRSLLWISKVSIWFMEKNRMWNPKSESQINPSRPNPGQREKIKLNFYFHTFSWCLKKFYEGLNGLHKTFWGTTKKCESKFFFQHNFQKCTGREGLNSSKSHVILATNDNIQINVKSSHLSNEEPVKLFGITVDDKFFFEPYLNEICQKFNSKSPFF